MEEREFAKTLAYRGTDTFIDTRRGLRHITTLHWAVLHDRVDLLERALKHGVQVDANNQEGESPLQWALERPSISCMNILLAYGATMPSSAEVWKILWNNDWTSVRPQHELVAHLLDQHRIDPHASDHVTGNTALHWIAQNVCGGGRIVQTIARLLEAGADPNIANRLGQTPLMIAASRNATVVGALLAHPRTHASMAALRLAHNEAHNKQQTSWWRSVALENEKQIATSICNTRVQAISDAVSKAYGRQNMRDILTVLTKEFRELSSNIDQIIALDNGNAKRLCK